MQGLTKVNKTINRGITAVAMTVAIATIYAAMPTENQVVRSDILKYPIQALLKFHHANEGVPQNHQDSQESLVTLLMSFGDSTYSHQ